MFIGAEGFIHGLWLIDIAKAKNHAKEIGLGIILRANSSSVRNSKGNPPLTKNKLAAALSIL